MNYSFEWDDIKNEDNKAKHQIGFEEARDVFLDSNTHIEWDHEHSTDEEDRWIAKGFSKQGNFLIVVYIEIIDGEVIRIISARKGD